MIINFSPQEVVNIAIKVEEAGEKLYAKLEYEAKDEKMKQVWGYLRQQEHIHREVFQRMLDGIGDYIVDNFNPGEYNSYLRAIASEYVFTVDLIGRKTQEGFPNDLSAIKFGIDIERESVLVYEAMKEFVVTGRHEVVDKIVNEEKKHLTLLIGLKASLRKEKGD